MPFRLVGFAYRSGINRCRFSRGVDFRPDQVSIIAGGFVEAIGVAE